MPHAIRMLVLDVDGVLTDGRLYFGPQGEALKAFHVHDGHGIRELQRHGIVVAVISGRRSRAVAARCRELGVRHLHQGVHDKLAVLERLCARLAVPLSGCAGIGDDLPDLPVLNAVALSFAVANAHPLVRRAARFVTHLPGGAGAVREVCDLLLAARAPRPARAAPRDTRRTRRTPRVRRP
jgi:3-deoxy-D-manno-octulosonate 8-phosphate phosphatase (KDO 8-P phosphatase)